MAAWGPGDTRRRSLDGHVDGKLKRAVHSFRYTATRFPFFSSLRFYCYHLRKFNLGHLVGTAMLPSSSRPLPRDPLDLLSVCRRRGRFCSVLAIRHINNFENATLFALSPQFCEQTPRRQLVSPNKRKQ